MAESPHHSVTSAASTQHEDPVADGAQKTSQHLMVAAQAAQTALHLRTALLNRRADRIGGGPEGSGDGEAGSTGQVATPAPIETARQIYAPMLTRDQGRDASLQVALAAWQAAQPFAAGHRDARQAHGRAQARLRTLEPEAMERFAALSKGLGLQPAMREVIPLLSAHAAAVHARESYAVVLGEHGAAGVSGVEAARAWEAAAPLRGHLQDAEVAAIRAEVRLRQLHPEVMARFDELRVSDPQQAMAVTLGELGKLGGLSERQREVTSADEDVEQLTAQENAPEADVQPSDQPEVRAELAAVPHAQVVCQVLEPELAQAVLADASWPKLADALERCQAAGLVSAAVLGQAVQAREMSDAAHPAGVLAHRVRELTAASASQSGKPAAGQAQDGGVPVQHDGAHAASTASGPIEAYQPQQDAQEPARLAFEADPLRARQRDRQDRPEPTEGSARSSEVARLRDLMYPAPLGNRSGAGRQEDPERVPAGAALLREQGEHAVVAAQVQASISDDVITGVDEHRGGLAASRDVRGQANAPLEGASVLEAQGGLSGWSPQDAAARKGVEAAMATFPTRLTPQALAAAHRAHRPQQGQSAHPAQSAQEAAVAAAAAAPPTPAVMPTAAPATTPRTTTRR